MEQRLLILSYMTFKLFSNGNCNKEKTEGKGQTCIPESIVAIATSAASLIV
jgi:hypothetical protein